MPALTSLERVPLPQHPHYSSLAVTRRRFLAGLATLPAAWSLFSTGRLFANGAPEKSTAATSSLDFLRTVISGEARFADSPWAISHALLAFGPELTLEGGEKAVHRLTTKLLRDDPAKGPHFELTGTPEAIGEMHPHLAFKTLAETGVEAELRARLAAAAMKNFQFPVTYENWDDTAWLLTALILSPGFSSTTKLGSSGRTLGDLAQGALSQVEAGDALVARSLAEGGVENFRRPSGGKGTEESGIWAFTCGGQHLLQASITAFQKGVLPASERERLAARIKLLPQRVAGESGFREREKAGALAKGADPIVAQHNCTLSLLKLNGHAMETYAKARDAGLGNPTELKTSADQCHATLERTVGEFQAKADLTKYLPLIRTGQPPTWRLWFGDGCHAIHGVGMWG